MRPQIFFFCVLLCLTAISRVRGVELSSDNVTCEIGNYENFDLLPPRAMFTLTFTSFTYHPGAYTVDESLLFATLFNITNTSNGYHFQPRFRSGGSSATYNTEDDRLTVVMKMHEAVHRVPKTGVYASLNSLPHRPIDFLGNGVVFHTFNVSCTYAAGQARTHLVTGHNYGDRAELHFSAPVVPCTGDNTSSLNASWLVYHSTICTSDFEEDITCARTHVSTAVCTGPLVPVNGDHTRWHCTHHGNFSSEVWYTQYTLAEGKICDARDGSNVTGSDATFNPPFFKLWRGRRSASDTQLKARLRTSYPSRFNFHGYDVLELDFLHHVDVATTLTASKVSYIPVKYQGGLMRSYCTFSTSVIDWWTPAWPSIFHYTCSPPIVPFEDDAIGFFFPGQAGAPINFTSLDGTITASSVLLQKDSSAATYRTIASASASDTQINSITYVNSTLLLLTVARAAALEPYAANLVCYSATIRYNASSVLRVSPTTFWVVYNTDNKLPAFTEGGLHCYHMWLTDQTSDLAGIYPTHVLEVTAAATDDSSESTSVWFYVAIPTIAIAALLIAVMVQHCVKYHSRGYKRVRT